MTDQSGPLVISPFKSFRNWLKNSFLCTRSDRFISLLSDLIPMSMIIDQVLTFQLNQNLYFFKPIQNTTMSCLHQPCTQHFDACALYLVPIGSTAITIQLKLPNRLDGLSGSMTTLCICRTKWQHGNYGNCGNEDYGDSN